MIVNGKVLVMAKPPTTYRPGQTSAPSGVYNTVGPRGGVRTNQEVSHTQGTPLPPTGKPGEGYQVQDTARHRGH